MNKSGKSPPSSSKTMSKNRPGSLTVPSYAFRFNAADDDLEVFEDIPDGSPTSEAPPVSLSPTTDVPSISKKMPTDKGLSDNSTPSTPTALSSRFSSKFGKSKREVSGKRSLSLDSQNQSQVVPEAAVTTSDSWSLFSEIKGKIAKTVEEKFHIDLHSSGNLWKKMDTSQDAAVLAEDEEPEATTDKEIKTILTEEPDLKDTAPIPQDAPVDEIGEPEPVRLRKPRKGIRVPSVTMSKLLDTSPVEVAPITDEKMTEDTDTSVPKQKTESVSENLTRKTGEVEVTDSNENLGEERQSWWIVARKWALITLVVLVYKLLALPSFVDGFIAGIVAVTYTNSALGHWLQPNRRVKNRKSKMWNRSCTAAVDRAARFSARTKTVLKVWMNELTQGEYDPEEFHSSSTQSVLVRLEGSSLRLSYPKTKIPKKAMWDEPRYDPGFINQRHCNMAEAKVTLLPLGLSRKRYWIRRYPICIKLKSQDAKGHKDHKDVARSKYDTLLLFSRCGREKEEWFRRFQVAASGQPLKAFFSPPLSTSESSESLEDTSLVTRLEKAIFEYQVYMDRLVPSCNVDVLPDEHPDAKKDKDKEKDKEQVMGKDWDVIAGDRPESVAWLNALLGRCFWDFMRSRRWAEVVREKIQKKLNKIKVPFWIEDVRLQDIHFGTQLPQVHRIAAPSVDERGLWVELSMSYYGGFCMTFETKINLLKLKKGPGDVATSESPEPLPKTPRLASVCDSDAEESMESSSDDDPATEAVEMASEDTANSTATGTTAALGTRTSKKLLRFVDIIAQSKYFQQATEYKYVKRAMEGVSNTRLTLTVEVHSLVGDVVLNIPPPPTDRIWYGFRSNPTLSLIAKPKVGERQVNFSHVTEWIEKKLALEFQKLFVIPNMDDLIIPIMDAWMDPPPCTNKWTPTTRTETSPQEVTKEAQEKLF